MHGDVGLCVGEETSWAAQAWGLDLDVHSVTLTPHWSPTLRLPPCPCEQFLLDPTTHADLIRQVCNTFMIHN